MRIFLIKLLIFLSLPTFLIAQTAYGLVKKSVGEDDIRAWESLSVLERNDILTGPFYPNVSIQKTEIGTYPKPEGFGVPVTVNWETDKYGYRKKQTEDIDMVIIGDSFIGGSGLTQEDMLTEKLEKITGMTTYPYAPGNINQFINDKRFKNRPPKIVMFANVEKLFQSASEIETEFKRDTSLNIPGFDFVKSNETILDVAVVYDRLKKKYFFDYMRVEFYKFLESARTIMVGLFVPGVVRAQDKQVSTSGSKQIQFSNMAVDGSMVFSTQADEYFIPVSDKAVNWNVWKMKTYQEYFESRGIRFIVAIIPNKENIYHGLMQREGKQPDFVTRFNKRAEDEGLEVIDLQRSFSTSRDKNPKDFLYHIDDSHWNAHGAQLAAEEIAKVILSK